MKGKEIVIFQIYTGLRPFSNKIDFLLCGVPRDINSFTEFSKIVGERI